MAVKAQAHRESWGLSIQQRLDLTAGGAACRGRRQVGLAGSGARDGAED